VSETKKIEKRIKDLPEEAMAIMDAHQEHAAQTIVNQLENAKKRKTGLNC
jgi:hypothetical protein